MQHIEYSVIIRTTGNAHEKYQQLLNSISQLKPHPQEVIVVLPEGYSLPEERLGWETFLFSKKGMVSQRIAGIAACRTEFALICDDDVSFSSDFVEKLHSPIAEDLASFSAGPLYSFLPDAGRETVLCILMASAVPTVFHRKTRYVTVLKSTGYSYNRHLDPATKKYYETQSLPWTCFYAHIPAFRRLELDKELWLDAHGYSALDDQTMFYKAYLMGMKTVVVSDAEYSHLDAKTSVRNNKPAVVYSAAFNRVVFMHRFLYSRQGPFGKAVTLAAFAYYRAWVMIRNDAALLRGRMTADVWKLGQKGYRDAWQYLKSRDYLTLPPLSRE